MNVVGLNLSLNLPHKVHYKSILYRLIPGDDPVLHAADSGCG